jgi:hypothetical protein
VIEATARIDGLEAALNAMRSAFPEDYKKQRSILNNSLSGAARGAIIPTAKQLALRGDESGALSKSIKPRARSYSKSRRRGAVASVAVTPHRMDAAAMAVYVNHYYSSKGLAAPAGLISGGIRHGHLIEFGTVNHPAQPFLYPALRIGFRPFLALFAKSIERKTQAAVKRAARKSK